MVETELFAPDDHRPAIVRFSLRILRIAWLSGRGFLRDDGFHHASALAFDTVLALVPLIVIVVGILRGLGAYEAFVHSTISPWIETVFGPSPEDMVTLREAILEVLHLGEQANVRALGFVGVLALLYLVVILLTTVESTLNRIWGARKPRSLMRRAVDYAAIIFVIPLGLFFASAVGTGFGDATWLGVARAPLRELLAIGAASAVLTFLYLVMPHSRTRFLSALIGGVVGGSLWHLGLMIYASSQIGVARYNALYSGFAALPLFLIWVFASWLMVLFGAEVAAAHQDERAFRWRVREGEASPRTRHRLGVRFVADITRAFMRGESPPDLHALADDARVPNRLAEDILDDLAHHGVLLRAARDNVPTFVLARDPRALKLSAVLAALDEARDPYEIGLPRTDEEARQLAELVDSLEQAAGDVPANLDLIGVVEWLDQSPEPAKGALAIDARIDAAIESVGEPVEEAASRAPVETVTH